MDRSALLKLIHKDLNELQLLLKGMEGYGDIPEPIIRLAKVKGEQLLENIHELPGEVRVAIHEAADQEREIYQPVSVKAEVPKSHTTDDEQLISEPVRNKQPETTFVEELNVEAPDEKPEEEAVNTNLQPETEPPLVQNNTLEQTLESHNEDSHQISQVRKKTKPVLGDTIHSGEKVFDRLKNDLAESLGSKLEGSPIKDLRKAININDKFMFQKELFENNREQFSDCLETLNSLETFNDALDYMVKNYNWDFEDDTTIKFVGLVNRRYK